MPDNLDNLLARLKGSTTIQLVDLAIDAKDEDMLWFILGWIGAELRRPDQYRALWKTPYTRDATEARRLLREMRETL